jgi:hypothetical protein
VGCSYVSRLWRKARRWGVAICDGCPSTYTWILSSVRRWRDLRAGNAASRFVHSTSCYLSGHSTPTP